MKTETKVQLAMAIIGIPVTVLVVWKPNAKWPNPFREALDSAIGTGKSDK
jgi:uncharacterized membrane protein YccC